MMMERTSLNDEAQRVLHSLLKEIESELNADGLTLIGVTAYKFKDWTFTESHRRPVTAEDRQERAKHIATLLMDNARWGSHGRGIPMKVLREELKLRIDDFGAIPRLSSLIHRYFSLVVDYVVRNDFAHLAHSREFL